ncbi:OmpW/AlkL family protein [Microbulbifer yueqingensis]|uniref:Outer membrane protein W n=1 Tax=Microbulbifer yueqingensis TaxID=658219 RepID=A0A1G8ULN3_9GAMM|nr:OmpW family outer membrane protein [Microbulbifer yueqingensis]SDJ53900.1 Outer membrane protein W [Microbulbifer yueqingensis]
MRLKPLLIPLAVAVNAGLAAQSALAGPSGYPVQAPPPPSGYIAGSMIVRAGAAWVDPDEDYRTFQGFLADNPSTDPVESVPIDVGVGLDIDDETTWFISGTYIFMDHWALELYWESDAGLDATLSSAAFVADTGEFIGAFSEGLGEFDYSTVSLYLDWFFLDPSCLWQPYVGIGIAYTNIDEDFIRGVTRVEGGRDHGLINFGSDTSWTAQVGVDLAFGRDDTWIVNASAMYVDSEPDLELGFNTFTRPADFGEPVELPVRIRDELQIDPWIFNLGVGYKFSF